MKYESFIKFPDQSVSFVLGVEYGRILEKMERGDEVVYNNRFPVHVINRAVIDDTCRKMNYVPVWGTIENDSEWVNFMAIRHRSTEN